MFLHQQKKRRIWPWVLLLVLLFFSFLVIAARQFIVSVVPQTIIDSGVVKKYIGQEQQDIAELLPHLLGFNEPKTYIVLFQNNTEMRPSGGFIGAYATVELDRGVTSILEVEGSEELDRRTPDAWRPIPPQPYAEHLGVSRWYFRDANWSPDFVESAKKARELYAAEGGVAAADIDGVIAVTPTVVEHLIGLTGPITIQGITFTKENVTETLEYEVEYGYKDRGIPFETRKQILGPFMHELLQQATYHAFVDFDSFTKGLKTLADQRHIIVSVDQPDVQKKIDEYGWSGRIRSVDGDYLAWIDTNLAALKTDHAIDRTLAYSIQPRADGRFVATARMTYQHRGTFDWRTSRYRTYARIFVPEGAELISVDGAMKRDRSAEPGVVEQGVELGKQWFGTFIAIEPKQTKSLTFTYLLPKRVSLSEVQRNYALLIQKQSGTLGHGLTLDLNFGTSITAANPGEEQKEWGDSRYAYGTDLSIDRVFSIQVK